MVCISGENVENGRNWRDFRGGGMCVHIFRYMNVGKVVCSSCTSGSKVWWVWVTWKLVKRLKIREKAYFGRHAKCVKCVLLDINDGCCLAPSAQKVVR